MISEPESTTDRDTVLIIAGPDDLHAQAVAAVLSKRNGVEPYLLSMEAFPLSAVGTFRISDGAPSATFRGPAGKLDFDQICSVWWRRPALYAAPDTMKMEERSFREGEVNHFLQGLLWSREVPWVNQPAKNRLAARKVVQLARARKIGLSLPETIVTNDPAEASAFIDAAPGRVIFKRIGTSRGGTSKTTLVTDGTLDRLDSIRETPTVFQEYIEPQFDLRITWIDGTFWSVAVDTLAGAVPEDSRFSYSVDYKSYELPSAVESKLRELMRAFGLRYAAIDMRVAEDGTHYFLELNPAGQFIYVELLTDLPLTEAMADALVPE